MKNKPREQALLNFWTKVPLFSVASPATNWMGPIAKPSWLRFLSGLRRQILIYTLKPTVVENEAHL